MGEVLDRMTPNSKRCLVDSGIIADKASAEVLHNVRETAESLKGQTTTDARGARRCLLLAMTSKTSKVANTSKATGFDRRAASAAVSYRKQAEDILYIRTQRKMRSNAITPATTKRIQSFFLHPDISRPMPSMRDVVRVRVAKEVYEAVPKQILEHTLKPRRIKCSKVRIQMQK